MTILEYSTKNRYSSRDLEKAFGFIASHHPVACITVEVKSLKDGMWDRTPCVSIDEAVGMLFDLSIAGYDVVGMDIYGGVGQPTYAEGDLFITVFQSKDHTSNISEKVMEKICAIKFRNGWEND